MNLEKKVRDRSGGLKVEHFSCDVLLVRKVLNSFLFECVKINFIKIYVHTNSSLLQEDLETLAQNMEITVP